MTLKVGAITFEVVEAEEGDKDFYDHLQEDGKSYYGRAVYGATQKVVLLKDIQPDRKAVTMMHEVIHIISDTYGLELEEHMVIILAAAMTQVLKDNEWILRL